MSGIWHPDRSQIPVAITARQLQGVAPIRLDTIARSHQPRRNHVTMNAQGDKLPIDDVARRTGLVTNCKLLRSAELLHQLADGFRSIINRADGVQGPVRLGHRDRDGLTVDIEADIARLRTTREGRTGTSD